LSGATGATAAGILTAVPHSRASLVTQVSREAARQHVHRARVELRRHLAGLREAA